MKYPSGIMSNLKKQILTYLSKNTNRHAHDTTFQGILQTQIRDDTKKVNKGATTRKKENLPEGH